MKLTVDIERFIKNTRDRTNAQTYDKVLHSILQEFESKKKQKSALIQPGICRYIVKNRITKFAAATVIIIGVLLTVSFLGGSPDGAGVAWARVLESLNNVQQVQLVANKTMPDGSVVTHKAFIRKPDCLYEERTKGTIIDNGQKRLWLFKGETAAAFFPTEPIDDHEIFKIIGLFQDKPQDGITITRLEEESDKTTIVFSVVCDRPEVAWVGKAWVDAETNLPIKLTVEFTSLPLNNQMHVSGEATLSYDPIPDEVFDITVPEGYTIVK